MSKNHDSKKDIRKLYRNDLSFCQYSTSNFKRAISFYSDVLGLEPSEFSAKNPIPESDGIYEFNLPVKGLILTLMYTPPEKKVVYDNLVISVTDLDKFKEILNQHHIETSKIIDDTDLSFMTLKDPDGNKITLLSDPRVTSK